MQPLVSIIIPTYKRSESLSRAIDSVLRQKYQNYEIIVVDDNDPNSEGRTQVSKIMESYKNNSKIKYCKHKKNLNGAYARNTGISKSKGQYITFLDDDDKMLENKLSVQVQALESDNFNEYQACYTAFKRVQGNKIETSGETRSGNLLVDTLGRNLIINAGSNVMFSREAINELIGFDTSFRRSQDLEFMARFFSKGFKIKYVPIVTLEIVMDERGSSLTNVRKSELFFEDSDFYIKKFDKEFKSLTKNDQNKVKKLLALEKIKVALQNKDFMLAIDLTKDVDTLNLVKYLVHLSKRKVTNKIEKFSLVGAS